MNPPAPDPDRGQPALRCTRGLAALTLALSAGLSGCGGGAGSSASTDTVANLTAPTTQADAVRLANQASFGPSEPLVFDIAVKGPRAWVMDQLGRHESSYTLGGDGSVHQQTTQTSFCDLPPANADKDHCWRNWYSEQPLIWDFYRNATLKKDQLRQRVALALQQIVVVSANSVDGTYGLRNYHNKLLDLAFGNYRDVLRAVALSPVMGDFLNGVNNDKDAPNENFARELLQLFSLGTCQLNADASLVGSRCQPVYDNTTVRSYAYALTGWTYPAGGNTPWGCGNTWNCRYYNGEMVSRAARHDSTQRSLLSGVTVPAGSTAEQALDKVLDSLMSHPNMAPFISRQLIQHLVTSNPKPEYVSRVAAVFRAGTYTISAPGASGTPITVGSGSNGDLAATVAAILLDDEARRATRSTQDGRLREPVMMIAGALRALNGVSDGDAVTWLGTTMQQGLFRPPSVFNFYPPDYPVPRTDLVGPAFGVLGANTGLSRLNVLMSMIWWGSTPDTTVPALPDGTHGTRVDLTGFYADAATPETLVDRLSLFTLGQTLGPTARTKVLAAIKVYDPSWDTDWQKHRVQQAAYLVLAAPQYQVLR